MDFTIEKYKSLLSALAHHKDHRIRHDVDLYSERSLRIAKVEAEAGVSATYYFRSMHFDSHDGIIKAIASLGHAVGYHYESLTTCNGDIDAAYSDFCRNLERLRSLAPVETACAHGSPRSPWNSQDIWKQHDIHALGISYEPMLDTDFSRTLYLTDTGRRCDGYRVSVRDKVPGWQEQWEREGLSFHSTDDIIHALRQVEHPIHSKALLLNSHPQRWMPVGMAWMAEAGMQWGKNIAKRLVVLNQNH
jgi:hypothetical protein